MKHIVLVVENGEHNLKLLGHHLVTTGGHTMIVTAGPDEAVAKLKQRTDITVVIAAHHLDDDSIETELSGANALAFAKEYCPQVAVAILVAPQVTPKAQQTAAKLGIDNVTTYANLQQILEEADLIPRKTRIAKPGELIIKS